MRSMLSFLTVATASVLMTSAVAAQSIRVGGSVSGSLEATDPVLSDNSHYDCFALDAAEGQNVTVSMTATDFTAYVSVVRGTSCDGEAVASNTDTLNVRLDGGPHRIRANSLDAGETGAYRLSVTEVDGAIAGGDGGGRKGVLIAGANGSRKGVLSLIDRRAFNRSYFDCYAFELPAGATLDVAMTSDEADAHLTLHRGDACLATAYVDANDDAVEGSTNARITRGGLAAGLYSVSAGGYDEAARGSYEIVVRSN
jgi:hypothetical protein